MRSCEWLSLMYFNHIVIQVLLLLAQAFLCPTLWGLRWLQKGADYKYKPAFFCFLMRFLDSNLPPNPKVPCSNSLCNEVKASWTWMVKPFRHWYVFWRLLPANVLVYWLSCVFDLLSLCVWKECVCLCVCFSETGCHRHSCLIWCVP